MAYKPGGLVLRLVAILSLAFLSILISSSASADNIDTYIYNLQDRDRATRIAAAEALGDLKDYRAIDPLIQSLEEKDQEVQAEAAKALGKIGEPKAVDPLIRLIEHSGAGSSSLDYYPQIEAIKALGDIGDPKAVNFLATNRYGPSSVGYRDPREYAEDALVKIGGPGVEELIMILQPEKNEFYTQSVIRILGTIGDPRAVEALIPKLTSTGANDRKIKEETVIALRKIGDRKAVDSLIQALRDSEIQREVTVTLGDWREIKAIYPLIELLKKRDSPYADITSEALVKIGEPAVIPLIQTLDSREGNNQRRVAEILGNIGDVRAVDSLIQVLNTGDYVVQRSAAEALGKIRDVRAVDPLIQSLENKDRDVRAKAAFSLGNLRDARATDPLIRTLNEDKAANARANAAIALGEIGDRKAEFALVQAMEYDKDSSVKEAAKRALQKMGLQ